MPKCKHNAKASASQRIFDRIIEAGWKTDTLPHMRSSRWESRHQNGKDFCCVYIDGSKTSIAEQQKMNTQRMQQHGDRWLPLLCYAINVELYWMRCQMHDHCYWLGNIAISHIHTLSLSLSVSLAVFSLYFHSFTFFPLSFFCHRGRRRRHGMHVFFIYLSLSRSLYHDTLSVFLLVQVPLHLSCCFFFVVFKFN